MSDKLNLYQKLQEARCRLQSLSLSKSGKNQFAGYSYFELGDILPPINNINNELGLCTHVTFDKEFATLNIINVDDGKSITFTSPMAEAKLKGAHDIQNLGATETYQRRYLYMSAYEIVEHDAVDSSKGKAPKVIVDTNLIPELLKEISEKTSIEELRKFWFDFDEKYLVNKRIKDAVEEKKKQLTKEEV